MGGPRYPPGPRPGVRMPQGIGNDFNGVSIDVCYARLNLACKFQFYLQMIRFFILAPRTTNDAK